MDTHKLIRPPVWARDVLAYRNGVWVEDDGRPATAFSGIDGRYGGRIPYAWRAKECDCAPFTETCPSRSAMRKTTERFGCANGRYASDVDGGTAVKGMGEDVGEEGKGIGEESAGNTRICYDCKHTCPTDHVCLNCGMGVDTSNNMHAMHNAAKHVTPREFEELVLEVDPIQDNDGQLVLYSGVYRWADGELYNQKEPGR